jgi:hypothetical protein
MRYAGEPGSNACCSVEPYYYDWYEVAPGCSGYDDYYCGNVRIDTPVCPAGGNCNKAVFQNCDPDENCEDNDGDGYYGGGPLCIEGTDCDDENADINPGKAEICGSEDETGERVDENCNYLKDCEEESCRNKKGVDCSGQCDKDDDRYYSEDCDGPDCKDNPENEPNASFIYPGSDVENTQELCSDEKNNDCDSDVDCDDSDCAEMEHCQIDPTPTPTPIDPTPTPPDPCEYDECCGLGTHTECTGGECEPDIEICACADGDANCEQDPYTGVITGTPICQTYPGDCEPEWCNEVCN